MRYCFYCARKIPEDGTEFNTSTIVRVMYEGQEINRRVFEGIFCNVHCHLEWLRWEKERSAAERTIDDRT